MNKREVIAMAQSVLAADWRCSADLFTRAENTFLDSEDSFFQMTTFGAGLCARGNADVMAFMREHFAHMPARFVMDPVNLFRIHEKLREHGHALSGEHDRFLRFGDKRPVRLPDGYTLSLVEGERIAEVWRYREFCNALNYDNDVIALSAFPKDGDAPVAMAAADNRMGDMWQIGVDTLMGHRHCGLGAFLVSVLADEIEARGKLPYYTTWMPNLASISIALHAGFLPAYVEYHGDSVNDVHEETLNGGD